MNEKKESRLRRARSTRLKIRELGAVRLCVNRTPRHIYAQVISADGATVLAQASTLETTLREGATVISTSTRNFPNRLGKNSNVFLGSAELAAIASRMGKLPTVAEYHEAMGIVNKDAASIYRYMNFDQIEEYVEGAKEVAAH